MNHIINVCFNCLSLQQGCAFTSSVDTNHASIQVMMFCHRVHEVSNQLPQVTLPEGAQPRLWHTVTALSLGPGQTQVTMFGGCPKWERQKTDDAQAKTTVLVFGEQNTYAVLTSCSILHELVHFHGCQNLTGAAK